MCYYRLYAHDEYYGASAEMGLKNWAHCTAVQLKQVETVVLPFPLLQHHLQLALGVRRRETKGKHKATHTKKKGDSVQDYMPPRRCVRPCSDHRTQPLHSFQWEHCRAADAKKVDPDSDFTPTQLANQKTYRRTFLVDYGLHHNHQDKE